jgi:hypothetical protein
MLILSLPAQGTGGTRLTETAAGNPFAGLPATTDIVFLPLDAHARALIHSVVPTVRTWLPPTWTEFTVIPATQSSWVNKARGGEWNGLAVDQNLVGEFNRAQGNRQVFIMAVTSEAVYDPHTPALNFVFGLLWWKRPQFAVVFGTRPMRVFQPQLERSRLTKMMLRYIGQVVCNQPRNSNPRSVLYQTILGTPDLDKMAATLPAVCRH